MAQSILHRADTRGAVNHGWLKSHHSFSFANYYNPDRIQFGALRVLNDDVVAGGRGFGEHPHDNMEIISIPLSGSLRHEDSMGNAGTIQSGEIQVMSAGTGIYHSEFNPNPSEESKFLQIWLFPKQRNVEPRYDQQQIPQHIQNEWVQILSPYREDQGVWIHQDAWFNLASFDAGTEKSYELHREGQGVYVFVLEGKIQIENTILDSRDALGVWETDQIQFRALDTTRLLLMEVPMNIH